MHKDRLYIHHKTNTFSETKPVLYWMQHSMRIDDNFALEAAIKSANKYHLPLRVLFIHDVTFKDSNLRHHTFMLEGLYSLEEPFKKLNIEFQIIQGKLEETILKSIHDASILFIDKSYLKPLRVLKQKVVLKAISLNLSVYEIESDLIIPIEKASLKAEFGARTLRSKLLKQVDTYLENATLSPVNHLPVKETSLPDMKLLLNHQDLDQSVLGSPYFKGGEQVAISVLEHFLMHNLKNYDKSNDPSLSYTSLLSPYLHFGQISPITIYQEVVSYIDQYPLSVESYLEQLLVRRELAFNYVYYKEGYDHFETMTDSWAYLTMALHRDDQRAYIYKKEDYLAFKTHDIYFNAAMKEMVITGTMHNYMRMYWGKKIIEWSLTYQEAYQTILFLNNRYFIDGRDPNSYAGVAWLFGKHDRPWLERAIFGKLRYMNDNGLKRKFDIELYVKRIDQL